MQREELKEWRQRHGLSRARLARMLGVNHLAVAFWEGGRRRLPPLLPLALEAPEQRMMKGGKNGFTGGVPGVQAAE